MELFFFFFFPSRFEHLFHKKSEARNVRAGDVNCNKKRAVTYTCVHITCFCLCYEQQTIAANARAHERSVFGAERFSENQTPRKRIKQTNARN